jgi:hypothetical protein
MYKIEVDTVRNRICITLSGFFSLEEIRRCGDETIEATRKVKRGFDVITDISSFKPGTTDVANDIQRVQAHFRTAGVRRAVRIVGKSSIASMQFSRTGKLADFQSTNVETMAEAEKILAAK